MSDETETEVKEGDEGEVEIAEDGGAGDGTGKRPADSLPRVKADDGETYALTPAWVTQGGVRYVDLQVLDEDDELIEDQYVDAIQTGEGADATYDTATENPDEVTAQLDEIHAGTKRSGPLEEDGETAAAPSEGATEGSDDPGAGASVVLSPADGTPVADAGGGG